MFMSHFWPNLIRRHRVRFGTQLCGEPLTGTLSVEFADVSALRLQEVRGSFREGIDFRTLF